MKAALLTYEGFDYSAPQTVDLLSGGTGWRAAWETQVSSSQYQVNSTTPLTYGSLQTTGNYTNGGGGFNSTGRRVDTQFGGVWDTAGYVSDPFLIGQLDQGNVWGSFLLRRDGNVPNWDNLEVTFNRNNTPWFSDTASQSLRISAVESQFSAQAGTGSATDITTSALGETLLFVVKWELSLTVGQNNIYLWVNPASLGGSDLNTATATWSATGLNTEQARWQSIKFYSGSNSSGTSLDELRFGTDYASITPIPEPTTALLGLAALAGLAVTRRRRNSHS
jgi:MYXO-CTERM domain-containing protein